MSENNLYIYKGKIIKVIDGDTFDIEVDLGFNIKHKIRVRLKDIDTPEIYGKVSKEEKELGLKIKYFLIELLLNKEIIIKTYKDRKGKYGRYIAYIYYNNQNLNDIIKSKFNLQAF